MNIELIIDPEFVACIPPLSQDEFEQLEENILNYPTNDENTDFGEIIVAIKDKKA